MPRRDVVGTGDPFVTHRDLPDGSPEILVTARIPGSQWWAWGRYLRAVHTWKLAELKIVPSDYSAAVFRPAADGTSKVSVEALELLDPPHEVYGQLLRSVPLRAMTSEALRYADAHEAAVRTAPPALLADLQAQLPEPTDAQKRALESAVLYLRAVEAGARNPLSVVADQVGAAGPAVIRDRLKFARSPQYGLMTTPGHGRAGGELTPKGHALAARYVTKAGRLRKRGNAR